jgi:hypothetical protein
MALAIGKHTQSKERFAKVVFIDNIEVLNGFLCSGIRKSEPKTEKASSDAGPGSVDSKTIGRYECSIGVTTH